MSHANRGAQFLRSGQPIVGWTTPSVTYDKMRQTDVSATILDADVRAYVVRQAFKDSWGKWFEQWKAFFNKTMTMGSKLGAIFNSDEIAQQAESYRQDLARWQDGYAREKDEQGNPLPSSNSPTVPIGPPGAGPPKAEENNGIPLWFFLLGVGAIGATVYAVYRIKKTYDMVGHRAALFEQKVVPAVLESTAGHRVGGALSEAATAHDCGCSRDLEMKSVPRPALKYLLSGF